MFAKVFEQIYDSSIAEDYNCRRMFMDLLVLADPTGAVDMTHEAIARRTNVPFDEVVRYVTLLCQPDPKSRSKMEEGKRLVPLDKNRDWGWKIVNYQHYRRIKDEEARRSYFRDAQRKSRAKKKKDVQEEVEEGEDRRSTSSNGVKPLSKTTNQGNGVFADRLSGMFGRRSATPWSEKEVVAFKKLRCDETEVSMLETYYRSERGRKDNICRRDLQTLLNNYASEVDRARAFCGRLEASQHRKEKAERKVEYQGRPIHELTESELAAHCKIVREASEQFKQQQNR